MSLFTKTVIACTSCGHSFEVDAVNTVNADRRPDYRDAILDGTFQVFECPSCSETVRLEPIFNYLEVAEQHWIAAHPGNRMPDYLEVEDDMTDVFSKSYGAEAMASAQSVGKDLNVRVTFGWSAVREKLIIASSGLSDVTIEMLKLDILRRVPDAPMALGVELRLDRADDDALHFVWLETMGEAVLRDLTVPRALLDDITNNADAWARVGENLTNGPFVDMQKLYMGEGRETKAAS